jgi:hypothetical protein
LAVIEVDEDPDEIAKREHRIRDREHKAAGENAENEKSDRCS